MLKKIFIEGMSCNHCVNHVKEALAELKDGLMSIFWTQKVKLFYAALLANNSH